MAIEGEALVSPIHLAREMRRRGWCYSRRRRGEATFGIRFSNGLGVTRVVPLQLLQLVNLTAFSLAEYLTHDAALVARHDMRRA